MTEKNEQKPLFSLSQEEFFNEMMDRFRSELAKLKKSDKSDSNELIPLQDCSRLFGVSLTTIHKWKKHGVLPKPIKIGGRAYFKKSVITELINTKNQINEGL